MSLSRRSFLRGMLAAGAAPAIIKASSLMPVRSSVIALPSGAGAILHGNFGKALWPGLEEWYGRHYAQYGSGIGFSPEVLDAQSNLNRLIRNMIDTKEEVAAKAFKEYNAIYV